MSKTADSALDLYRGAQAFVSARTIGLASKGARLGARKLVQGVDEFGSAAFSGLRRGLDRLSVASQYAVIQQIRELPTSARRAIAQQGDRTLANLVAFSARTRTNVGRLATKLGGERFTRFVQSGPELATDGGYSDDVAELWQDRFAVALADTELSDPQAREILDSIDRLPPTARKRLGDAVGANPEAGSRLVRSLDAETLSRIANQGVGAGASAVDLLRMGLPAERIRTLVDSGVNLRRFDNSLREYATARMKLQDRPEEGDIGEILADATVIRRATKYGNSDRYTIYPSDVDDATGVEIRGVGEFDHVVVDDETGNVVAIFETKISTDPGRNPTTQVESTLNDLRAENDPTISYRLSKDQFEEPIAVRSIGPRDATFDYDYTMAPTNQEFAELYDVLQSGEVTTKAITQLIREG